jgi:hypothetical protein
MKIYVLFIKRHFALDDAPEAYSCCDEETRDVNPDWFDQQVATMLKDCGSDMVGGQHRWIAISVSGNEIENAFAPEVHGMVVSE